MTESNDQFSSDKYTQLVAGNLSAIEICLASTGQEVNVSGAIRLPLSHLPELGVAFASLPEAFRTVTSTVSVPTLLQATDKFGSPLDPSVLQAFNDGSGLLGSFRDAANGFGQARFHVVPGGVTTSVTQVPYNPTALFVAAALAQINQKLDCIQGSVDEMFDYLRQKDKSNMRGDLKTLAGILNDYALNYGIAAHMVNDHMKVLDIKQASERYMDFSYGQARAGLQKKEQAEVRAGVEKRLDKVLDHLKDAQLATYIHAFSLFLEPMLAENFGAAKLADTAAKIEADSLAYRELYTECYDALEASTAGSIDAAVLDGIASAGKRLGRAIAETPVGEHTPINGALENAGEVVGRFNKKRSEKLMAKLLQAKMPDIAPFKQSMMDIDALYNRPTRIAVDAENIYILPAEQPEE